MTGSKGALITDDMIKREMERCRSLFDGDDYEVAVHDPKKSRVVGIPIQALLSTDSKGNVSPILYEMALRNLMEAEGKPRILYSVDLVAGKLVSREHHETAFGSGVFEVKSSEQL